MGNVRLLLVKNSSQHLRQDFISRFTNMFFFLLVCQRTVFFFICFLCLSLSPSLSCFLLLSLLLYFMVDLAPVIASIH